MEINEIEESAKTLSIAMLNNPLHVAVLQGNEEKQRLKIESMFTDLFHTHPGLIYLAREGQKIVGVMRMKSCKGAVATQSKSYHCEEHNIEHRIRALQEEWAKNDPTEQHWHLGPIGVVPSHQGRGIGSLFMKIFCSEVDKCSAKAFLETDLDKNVSFYKKFGFKVVGTSNIFGVESRYMTRETSDR